MTSRFAQRLARSSSGAFCQGARHDPISSTRFVQSVGNFPGSGSTSRMSSTAPRANARWVTCSGTADNLPFIISCSSRARTIAVPTSRLRSITSMRRDSISSKQTCPSPRFRAPRSNRSRRSSSGWAGIFP